MRFSFRGTRSARDESVCFNYKHQNEIIKICVLRIKTHIPISELVRDLQKVTTSPKREAAFLSEFTL
jgi:hypothetical protein